MKVATTILLQCLLMHFAIYRVIAQDLPQNFNYQAAIRDENGGILSDTDITIRITLYSVTNGDTSMYKETHATVTNEFGLVNLIIGAGVPEYGNFGELNWNKAHSMTVESDTGGGYINLGTQPLLAVPYALTAMNGWTLNGNSNTSSSSDFIGTTDPQGFQLRTNNTPRMHVAAGGRIAFGTEDTSLGDYTFHSNSNSTRLIMSNQDESAYCLIEQDQNTSKILNPFGEAIIMQPGNGLVFYLGSNSRAGFGTTLPEAKFQIAGGSDLSLTDPNGGFLLLGSTNSSNLILDQNEIMSRNNGETNTLFLNTQGGAVVVNQNTTPAFSFAVNGTCAKPGGGSWSALSDARLKQNIQSYSSGLEILNQIEPVTYSYTPESGYDSDIRYVGVIAQDLQKIIPTMVHERALNLEENPEEKFLTVDPSEFTYVLINAVKELSIQNEKLQLQLQEQQIQINQLLKISK